MCANEARADRRSAGRDEGTLQVISNHVVVRSLSPSKEMALMKVGPGGIETISGALKKPKKQDGHNHGNYVVATHRKAASTNPNCQRLYVKDPDAYKRTTPLSPKELQIRARFTAVRAMIAARKEDLSKITDDQIAFAAQKNLANGKKTMLAWYWKVCGQEYDQTHNG